MYIYIYIYIVYKIYDYSLGWGVADAPTQREHSPARTRLSARLNDFSLRGIGFFAQKSMLLDVIMAYSRNVT